MRCGWSVFFYIPSGSSVQQQAVIKRLFHLLLDCLFFHKKTASFCLDENTPLCLCHTYISSLAFILQLGTHTDGPGDVAVEPKHALIV